MFKLIQTVAFEPVLRRSLFTASSLLAPSTKKTVKAAKGAPKKKVVVGKTLKLGGDKKTKGQDTGKKAEIEEALAFIAPQTQRAQREKQQMKKLCQIAACRDEALSVLQAINPQLHAKALEIDQNLYPQQMKLPTDTPAPNL